MLLRKSAVNYAKALFAVPASPEEIQKREADLEHLVAIMRKEPYVLQLLCYPELPAEERLTAVEKLLNLDFDPVLERFLGLLLKKRKVNHLIAVASEYQKLIANDLGTLDVNLQSAEPLSTNTRQEVVSKLEKKFKKKINLIESLNPNLISGFVLLIGNKLLDLSIRGKLTKLKKLILKGEA